MRANEYALVDQRQSQRLLLSKQHTRTGYSIGLEVDAEDIHTLAAHCSAPLAIGFSQLVIRSCLNIGNKLS